MLPRKFFFSVRGRWQLTFEEASAGVNPVEVGLLFWDPTPCFAGLDPEAVAPKAKLGHPSSVGVCVLTEWFGPLLGESPDRGQCKYPE